MGNPQGNPFVGGTQRSTRGKLYSGTSSSYSWVKFPEQNSPNNFCKKLDLHLEPNTANILMNYVHS